MSTWLDSTAPSFTEDSENAGHWLAAGDWTFLQTHRLIALLARAEKSVSAIDGKGIQRLDATGSHLLLEYLERHRIDPEAAA